MTEGKKKILISKELLATPVDNFFQTAGLECVSVFKKENVGDYCFVLNDHCPEVNNIPRIQFDKNFIDFPEVQKLFKLALSESELDLVGNYSNDFKKINSIKIHEYLNVGYFIDLIVIDAYKNKFDYDLVRKYLNGLFEYAFGQIETLEVSSVLELVYSFSDDVFVLELTFIKEKFNLNNNKVSELSNKNNFFNMNYFAKRNKVTLSSLWFKNEKLKSFRSSFYSEMSQKEKSSDLSAPLALGIEGSADINYSPRDMHQGEVQGKKLSDARKFSLFIKNYRSKEEAPKDLISLEVSDIDDYLTRYPLQKAVLDVDDEVKKCVLQLLKDEIVSNHLTEHFEKIASSNLDPQIEQIQRILGEKSLSDLEEIIRIKGTNSDEASGDTVVKGWFEEELKDVVIKSVTDSVGNNAKWEVKRTELGEKIKEEIIRIKGEGGNLNQDDIIKIISKEVSESPDNIKVIVKDLVEEAIACEVAQGNNLEEAVTLKFAPERIIVKSIDNGKAKLEGQVVRMRKIMEQMKGEISKLRSDSAALSDAKVDEMSEKTAAELLSLKSALSRTLETLKNKEKISLKQKTDFEQILEAKENHNKNLESRLEQMRIDLFKTNELSDDEKLNALQTENKNLTTRLDLANKKISNINENMNNLDSVALVKKDKEITSLKASVQMAQTLIEKLKQERDALANKPAVVEKTSAASIDLVKASEEKDQLVTSLQIEKKLLEEKFRAQGLDLKKLEQKFKFASAQADELQKRKSQPTVNDKGNAAYIKQVENANSRLNDANNELTEKKKDLIKFKQENALLSSKLSALEKKLSNLEKKAA
jgi:hypothetical protein